MSGITTHVLDTSRGRPAAGVPITLERRAADGVWSLIGEGRTDDDGRLRTLMGDAPFTPGLYRLTFDTDTYLGGGAFFPNVTIVFEVKDAAQHYHVPLLLSPFGYSTYRGS